jgi:hypothetical protein
MSTDSNRAMRAKEQTARPWAEWMSCKPTRSAISDCRGSGVERMAGNCPCGAVLRSHRFVAFAALAGMTLTILVGATGIILGIIAFFRTI